ncbi:MAG TPA: alpha/beta hydrolase-fold protein [Candidatus Limnocylindrales bacterium]|nr:alpha/beta hydrolase-fold protein [Candidatus Limnocylindrales bacterium]
MLTGRGESVGRPAWRSTITGRVDVTHLLRAGQRRAVRIYLPPGYEVGDREYPVLYMFDGQNLFDRTTTAFGMEWGIDESIEDLVDAGHLPGVIVVGIDSPDGPAQRYAEYTAWDWMLGGVPVVADGAATADFLVDQVIPHVQTRYRVAHDRARVGLSGSSMGGYMTLFVGVRHPEVFGRLLAFSPIVLDEPMGGHELRDYIVHRGFEPGTWVYVDMGDAEELSYIDHPDRVVEDLAATTVAVTSSVRPPARVVSRVIPGASHDERAWGARFAEVLLWAFADGPEPR